LINTGTATSESGVVSASTFSLNRGFTVEFDGRMRFTGKPHQVFGIALYDEKPVDSLLAAGATAPILEFRVEGPVPPEHGRAIVATTDSRHEFPIPDNERFWRRYALQVRSDGGVELIVDGAVYWRSSYLLPESMLSSVYLVLGFQSFEAMISHGEIKVYEETKYRLPVLDMFPEPRENSVDATTSPVGS